MQTHVGVMMADRIKQDSARTFPTPIKPLSVSNSSMSTEVLAVAMLCNTSISNSVIIILLVSPRPWNLPVLHRTIISLWQGTIIKILFRYSPIICQTQHHVLAKGQKRENVPQSFLYHWTITIFMRGALQGEMVSFILYYFHSLYYILFFPIF